jgi:hypothetical protein
MPDGYPTGTEAWTGSLLARWNFAFALCHGSIKGTSVDDDQLSHIVDNAFLGSIDAGVASKLASAIAALTDPRDRLAACLASPEFQWR